MINENFRDFRLRFAVTAEQHHVLVRLCRAAHHAPDSHLAHVFVGVQRRHHQLQRAVLVAFRCGNFLYNCIHQRHEVVVVVRHVEFRNAVPRRAVYDGEIKLVVVSAQLHEKLQHFVVNVIHALVGAVDLVDDHDRFQFLFQRFAKHILRLRHRSLEGVHQEQHAVDEIQHALDLAAKIRVARCVDDVDLYILIHDGGMLRENRDAALALDIPRIHHALCDLLVGAEHMALLQHCVHQCRLAVINVRDNRHISEFFVRAHAVLIASCVSYNNNTVNSALTYYYNRPCLSRNLFSNANIA